MALLAHLWTNLITFSNTRRGSYSLPWPLCAVRRNQDPASSQQVEAPVRDVVENGVSHDVQSTILNLSSGREAWDTIYIGDR